MYAERDLDATCGCRRVFQVRQVEVQPSSTPKRLSEGQEWRQSILLTKLSSNESYSFVSFSLHFFKCVWAARHRMQDNAALADISGPRPFSSSSELAAVNSLA